MKGVFGKILNINLDNQSFSEESIVDSVYEKVHWRWPLGVHMHSSIHLDLIK